MRGWRDYIVEGEVTERGIGVGCNDKGEGDAAEKRGGRKPEERGTDVRRDL